MDKKVLQAQTIKAEAARLGFSACGLARAERVDQTQEARFRKWIAEGKHGEMDYLARNIEKRMDPRLLVEGAQTMVAVAMNYLPAHLPEKPPLARYAYGKDYHDVVRERLLALMQSLNLKPFEDGRAFVDTAPVDERYWAVKAGLGWTGRNGQLIIPRAGSYFFLGELILVHPADAYDSPKRNLCGNCRACVDACPAGALCGDGSMDARKCLSYLTIEHRAARRGGRADGRLLLRLRPLCGSLSVEPFCPPNAGSRLCAFSGIAPNEDRGLAGAGRRNIPPPFQRIGR